MASPLQDLIKQITDLATDVGNLIQLRGFKRGGTAGQVPVKTNSTDFNWSWGDVTEGGGVTDHGALTGRDDDDHTQYFNQERGDARYPSITYAGANPNHPQSLTLTGVDTAGVNGTLVYCGLIYGKAAWSSDGSKIAGLANPLNTLVSSGAAGDIWLVQRGDIYAANKASTAATPAGLTGWLVVLGSGQPVIAASITAPSLPVGTHIGQFCQASGGLWRWSGTSWIEVTATASSISNAAVLAALPSSTPLPITSGGTGAANLDALQPKITSANASTTRTDLELGSTNAVQFGVISTTAQPVRIPLVYSNASDFTNPTTGFQNVPGLSFPVLANKNYSVNFSLVTNKSDSAGLAVQITGPASPTKVAFRNLISTSSMTTLITEIATAFSTPSTTFNTFAGDGLFLTSGLSLISNGLNAGTVQLQLRAVTGGTAKIYAGSWIQVTQLN